jgi:hypothetical protein
MSDDITELIFAADFECVIEVYVNHKPDCLECLHTPEHARQLQAASYQNVRFPVLCPKRVSLKRTRQFHRFLKAHWMELLVTRDEKLDLEFKCYSHFAEAALARGEIVRLTPAMLAEARQTAQPPKDMAAVVDRTKPILVLLPATEDARTVPQPYFTDDESHQSSDDEDADNNSDDDDDGDEIDDGGDDEEIDNGDDDSDESETDDGFDHEAYEEERSRAREEERKRARLCDAYKFDEGSE